MGKEFTTSQPIVALTQKLKNLTDMIDFSKMTDEEFFSPAPKEPFPPQENECIEIHRHKTPSGGDLSIAYFYDKNGTPCSRANAHHMNIVEYKNDGTRINEHYGAL